jgi:chromosomal replication initiation ATPase DnaA
VILPPRIRALVEDVVAESKESGVVTVESVLSKSRNPYVMAARRDLIIRLRGPGFRLSFPAIGRLLNRHHASIMYYVQEKQLIEPEEMGIWPI